MKPRYPVYSILHGQDLYGVCRNLAKLHGMSNSLPVCPIIGGGEGSLISGNLGGESWKLRLQESPLDVDPAGERDRPSVSWQSSGDFLRETNNKGHC